MDVKKYNEINEMLAEWDPIGIGYPLSKDEYKGLIPKIYEAYKNGEDLKKVFISILQDDFCLSINTEDINLNRDLEELISRLMEIIKTT
jgi:hypothetical protein